MIPVISIRPQYCHQGEWLLYKDRFGIAEAEEYSQYHGKPCRTVEKHCRYNGSRYIHSWVLDLFRHLIYEFSHRSANMI